MRKHRREHEEAVAKGEASGSEEDERKKRDEGHRHLERAPPGSSSSRSVAHGSRPSRNPEDSDSDVEELPDRFDRQGHSLDPESADHRSRSQWTTRSGEFERRPQKQGDWDVRGSWQVGGTDPEAVERMVKGVTGALEGKSGWIGLVGSVLSSGLLSGGQTGRQLDQRDDDEGEERRRGDESENRGRHRRR